MNDRDKKLIATFQASNEEWKGAFGEAVWSNIFRASGVNYIPLKDIETGGAPKVITTDSGVVLPDFDCACDLWTAFVDSKCKSQPVFYRRTGKDRHGINQNHYEAYRRAGEIYRKRCAVGVVELFRNDGMTWSGALLVERLDSLGYAEPSQPGTENPVKVYWNRKQFVDLDSLSPSELMDISKNVAVPSYKYELEKIFAPFKQCALF